MAVYEQSAKHMSDMALAFLQNLYNLLKAMIEDEKGKKIYKDIDGSKGMYHIMKHIKNGGQLRTQTVSGDDGPLFEQILKSRGIPYLMFTEGTGENQKTIFFTRDTDDKRLQDVWDKFRMEVNVGLTEMSFLDFVKQNEGQDISRTIGYDRAEVEVFRRKIISDPCAYAVVPSDKEEGKFDIVYLPRDREKISNALKDMHYELSGSDGRQYKEQLLSDIDSKKQFESKIKPDGNKKIYILDKDNPHNFIAVTSTGFSVHSLSSGMETLKDGTKHEYIDDPNVIKSNIYDRDRIMKYVEGLGKPVILTEKEVSFVKGIAPDGKAVLDQKNFKAEYEEVKNKIKDMEPLYKGLSKRMINNIGKTHVLMNIPQDKLSEIMVMLQDPELSDKAIIQDKDIAFSEYNRTVIEPRLESILYRDMDPLERFENELYYKGNGNIELKAPKETKFLVSATDPEFVIAVGPDGFDIHQNGNLVSSVAKDNPEHDKLLLKILKTIKEPVVLTKDEMSAEKNIKTDIINNRRTENQQSKALEYLENNDRNKKLELHNIRNEGDAFHLDQRQKDAAHEFYRHEVIDTYVDRTFTEKVFDMDTGRKLRESHRNTVEVER